MKTFTILLFILFILYSLSFVVYTEFFRPLDLSEAEVSKMMSSDFLSWTTMYSMNSIFSSFFLCAAALLFAFCIQCIESDERGSREQSFYISQMFFFAILGMAKLSMFHKALESLLSISPIVLILGAAFLEFCLIALLSDWGELSEDIRSCVYKIAIFFMIAMFVNLLFSWQIKIGIAIENLSQAWSSLFSFLFAWRILQHKISSLKGQGHSLTNLIVVRRTENERKGQPIWME